MILKYIYIYISIENARCQIQATAAMVHLQFLMSETKNRTQTCHLQARPAGQAGHPYHWWLHWTQSNETLCPASGPTLVFCCWMDGINCHPPITKTQVVDLLQWQDQAWTVDGPKFRLPWSLGCPFHFPIQREAHPPRFPEWSTQLPLTQNLPASHCRRLFNDLNGLSVAVDGLKKPFRQIKGPDKEASEEAEGIWFDGPHNLHAGLGYRAGNTQKTCDCLVSKWSRTRLQSPRSNAGLDRKKFSIEEANTFNISSNQRFGWLQLGGGGLYVGL